MNEFGKSSKSRLVKCLCAGALLYATAAPAATTEGFVQEAESYLQSGEINAAMIQLKNALRQDPDNARARLLLGETYLKQGQGAAATKELSRARKLGTDVNEVLVPLGRALIMQGAHQKVLDDIQVPEDASAPLKAEILALHGQAELALGRLLQAREQFEKAYQSYPDSATVQLGLARIALVERDYERASPYVARALELAPKNVDAWLVKGEMARLQGDLAVAKDAFVQALAVAPDNVLARLGRATVQIGLQEYDAAQEDVASVLGRYPQLPAANHLQAVLAYNNKDMVGTEQALQKVLSVAPGHLPSMLLLGASLYAQGKFEQARPPLERYLAAIPGHSPARKLLGAIQLRLGQPREAIAVLEVDVEQSEGDAQWLALLGSAYSQAGDADKATEWLEKAVAVTPDVAALRNQLAISHLRQGEAAQAVSELESAVDLGQDVLESDVLLIFAHLRNQELDEALHAAQALAEKLPDNPMPYNLLGAVYGAKRDFDTARIQFEKALSLSPDYHAAAINLARMDVSAGQFDQAEERLKKILDQDEGHLGAMLALAQLAIRQGRQEETQQWLERARDQNPTAVRPGLVLARFHWQRGDLLAAVGIARELQRAHPKNTQVLELLGSVRMAMGEYASATDNFQRAVDLQPQSPKLLLLLANAQAAAKRNDAAADSLDQALSLQSDYLPAQMALGRLKQRTGKPQEALEIARQIQQQHPQSAQGQLLEGDIHMGAKEYGEAVRSYAAGFEQKNTSELAIKLFQARWQGGEAGALDSLQRWITQSPGDLRVRQILAQAYLRQDQADAAIEQYQAVVEAQPENIVALNNLAWLYHTRKDAQAVDFAQRAYDLAPDKPEIADTLGWLLLEQGDPERGLELLQEAAGKAPHIPAIRYHRAVALAKNQRRDEARKELERLLRDHSSFAEEEDARSLLAQLKGQQ